jgi:hypothetical protein
MARGNSRAQSEAGTVERSKTLAYRIKSATDLLKNLTTGGINRENADLAEQVLNRPRSNEEEYDIDLRTVLAKAGKLNMMDGTIDGKEIARPNSGAFDKTTVGRRASPESRGDFRYEAQRADIENGFIFAADAKGQVYAIPHTWNTNDPQGTVGVFKNDNISFLPANSKEPQMTLRVIGTFDSSKRGLNLAAAAAGDALGRSQGVKQTAILLGNSKTADLMTDQRGSRFSPYSGFVSDILVNDLNNGQDNATGTSYNIKKRVG